MKKIYLAGPDVFSQEALQIGNNLKKLCGEFGFRGMFPLDNVINDKENPELTAQAIREANINLIESSDIVMANLNPFRGLEPDSGTVFEVGYALAMQKEIYCYAGDRRAMIRRIREAQNLGEIETHCLDGQAIENYNLSHNLMFGHLVVADDAESCLAYIKRATTLNR